MKATLRAQLKASRAAIDAHAREAASASASWFVASSAQLKSAKTIALYAAFGAEADPAGIEAAAPHARFAYPRVAGDHLTFHFARRAELAITPNTRFPIAEPRPDAPLAGPDEIELYIVPGLAFTRAGLRLGYGKGHYDRVLRAARAANPRVVAIGFAFEAQIVGELPADPHDERVDFIATERGLFAAGATGPL